MLLTFVGPGIVAVGIAALLLSIVYFVLLDYIKPRLIKLGVWLIMNHLGALDKDIVKKRDKYLQIQYTHLGTQYNAVVPIGKNPPRGRRLYIEHQDSRIDITNIRGARYNFSASDLGVDRVVLTETKIGETKDIRIFKGDDPVSMHD